MKRVAGLFVLAVCAFAVAGCGGSSLQKAALDDASPFVVGQPQPTSVRTEYFQDVGGMREAVLFMHGHFKIHGSCAVAGAPCRPFYRASLIMVDVSLPDPKASWGFGTESPAQAAALATARSASPMFKIFPDFTNPAVRCTITSGGPTTHEFAGACSTIYKRVDHVTQVEFRERWPFVKTRDGHWPRGEKTGGWIVTIGRGGHIESIRETGQLPPQLWE
jgi:hypothetical protein